VAATARPDDGTQRRSRAVVRMTVGRVDFAENYCSARFFDLADGRNAWFYRRC
jgi:hypothetical protein